MNAQQFEALAHAKGLRIVGKAAYGWFGDFPVTLSVWPDNRAYLLLSIRVPENCFASLKKDLKETFGKQARFTDGKNGFLNALFGAKQGDSTYDVIRRDLPGVFSRNMVRATDTCPICKRDNCDSVAHVGLGAQKLHRRCLQEMHRSVQEEAEQNLNNGSYFLGILGGLIGGLVGCLPNVLTIVVAQRIYSLLFALIPLCVYHGYRLCKGKLSKAVIVYTCILSLILAVFVDFASTAILVLQEFPGTPMGTIIEFMLDPEVLPAILTDSLSSLAFVVIGIVITWSQITRTAAAQVTGVADMMSTLVPLEGAEDGYTASSLPHITE